MLAIPAHVRMADASPRMALLPSSAKRDGHLGCRMAILPLRIAILTSQDGHLGCGMAILPPRMAIPTSQNGEVAILTFQDGSAAILTFENGKAIFAKELAAGRRWRTHGKHHPSRVRFLRRKVGMASVPFWKGGMASLPFRKTGMAIFQPETRMALH